MSPIVATGSCRAARACRSGLDIARSVAIETVYPRRCAGCGRRGSWVCLDCRAALTPFQPPWCDGCGVPPNVGPCRCDVASPTIRGARAVAPFAGWLRSAILDFKYRDERARADHLGGDLAAVVRRIGAVDALVPVPLHPSRERRRGYNQAALLAARVGTLTGSPTLDVLRRSKPTVQQVGLVAEDRRRNVKDAFSPRAGISLDGARLVLIDDVMTTGSTAGACADALRDAGATEVWVATLAREL